jgi:nucleoside-diphosphate-sugar epimerase
MLISLIGNDRVRGEAYNAAGAEFASILGCVHLMARAVGVEPTIVPVPTALLKTLGRPVVHWGEGTAGGIVVSITKALDHLDWAPRIGLAEGYRDSYAWYAAGGRDMYDYDFSFDDEVLAHT